MCRGRLMYASREVEPSQGEGQEPCRWDLACAEETRAVDGVDRQEPSPWDGDEQVVGTCNESDHAQVTSKT